ncbi:hypothetical protein KEG38_22700 [Polyangium jinanense]|uniref:Uncharacterized protein n=1 Tax=Polyangium jinanense TaxID=2829994 RepID=A0A9X3XBC0_9BACT|nr:hypothetical protein [Polyangium jinanense]MDC3984751.1 hypothetical protein [Polyangium jinanense]
MVCLSGCAGVGEISEDVLEAEGVLVQGNKLAANSLALNSLALNGIALNGIGLNSMDPTSLSAIQDAGVKGARARAFLRYAIGCAFAPSQSFAFTWWDAARVAHEETYHGELGVAPGWSTGPLDLQGQRMVSACVAARVNYYEVPVLISIRSTQPPLEVPGDKELDHFPDVEGAFWGNLWGTAPAIYACYNSETVANSRGWSRDCAAGHLRDDGTIEECGMIDIVGPCSAVCGPLISGGRYYRLCGDKPDGKGKSKTNLVVTTALP